MYLTAERKGLAFLAGKKLENDDFLISMSRKCVRPILEVYGQRWLFESLFRVFKSCGVDLEKCLVNPHRRIRTGEGLVNNERFQLRM